MLSLGRWEFFPSIDPVLLIPTAADLAEIGAVWLSALLLLSLGRVLTRGRALPEVALLAGWGVLAAVFSVWGAFVPATLPLWYPAAGIAIAGAIGLLLPGISPRRADWLAIGRAMLLSLPLWAVMASEFASQPDTYLNLLPNAAYLYDHGFLPAVARPESHSFLPGAPYNLQFWAFFASTALPALPPVAMAHVNLLLLVAFGLLLARIVQFASANEALAGTVPSWGAIAFGLLLATALNPGFVPRVWLTDYGETAIAVALGAAGFLVASAFGSMARGSTPWPALASLSAILLALVEIKQESIAFVIALAVSIPLLGLLDRQVGLVRATAQFAPTVLPAAFLYLLWRWYVLNHLAGDELQLLPLAQWNWPLLPQILRAILATVAEKGIYFGFLAIALALLIWRLWRRPFEFATRLLALSIGVTLGYDIFLVIAYVVTFSPRMASDAHSFFRYSTHLSLILVLSLTALARTVVAERPGGWRKFWRIGQVTAVTAVLLIPVVFAGRLRFDLMMPQPLIRALARDAAGFLAAEDKLALVLPGDGGSVATMIESILRYEPPRRPGIDLSVLFRIDRDTLPGLARQGVTKVLISCVPAGLTADLPVGQAVLLQRKDTEWQWIAAWVYPPRGDVRWASSLSPAALCSPP